MCCAATGRIRACERLRHEQHDAEQEIPCEDVDLPVTGGGKAGRSLVMDPDIGLLRHRTEDVVSAMVAGRRVQSSSRS